MFARFDENPTMTLQDIKEKQSYGRTDRHTDGRENCIPTTNKVCRGYKNIIKLCFHNKSVHTAENYMEKKNYLIKTGVFLMLEIFININAVVLIVIIC